MLDADLLKFAARLNSFAVRPELYWQAGHRPTTADLLERASKAKGLNAVDLNYPDHLADMTDGALRDVLDRTRIALNGFQMRYYSGSTFTAGGFAHPDAAVREQAIKLTLEGIDRMAELGVGLMTLWLGQDGFDYPFQADYGASWEHILHGLTRVASHNPDVQISVEYKPNEPRAFSFLGDVGTTLLALREVGLPNLGVTIDFCHVLYADEQPAFAASLVHKHSKLLGLHLNDGYAKRDDGLMVGSVHLASTLELLCLMQDIAYDGVVYFDTFPHAEDPVAECATNIEVVKALWQVAAGLDRAELKKIHERHDAVAGLQLFYRTLLPQVFREGV